MSKFVLKRVCFSDENHDGLAFTVGAASAGAVLAKANHDLAKQERELIEKRNAAKEAVEQVEKELVEFNERADVKAYKYLKGAWKGENQSFTKGSFVDDKLKKLLGKEERVKSIKGKAKVAAIPIAAGIGAIALTHKSKPKDE